MARAHTRDPGNSAAPRIARMVPGVSLRSDGPVHVKHVRVVRAGVVRMQIVQSFSRYVIWTSVDRTEISGLARRSDVQAGTIPCVGNYTSLVGAQCIRSIPTLGW